MVVLPTRAGKSLVIAELARKARGQCWCWLTSRSWWAEPRQIRGLGLRADIFAAGLASQGGERPGMFGSVRSVARNLAAFGRAFSLLIIDRVPPGLSLDDDSQYHRGDRHLKAANPGLKILRSHRHPLSARAGLDLPRHYHGMVKEPRRAALL